MLDWLVENKDWFFSGIGCTILALLVGFLLRKKNGEDRKGEPTESATYSVHLAHSGSGDNVGRDKVIKG